MTIPQSIINLVKKEIVHNDCPFRHISIICYKGKPVSFGLNKVKTHPRAKGRYSYIHSEFDAICRLKRQCGIDLSRTTLYNVRVGASGNMLLSRPCDRCSDLILAANFKKVYYTNNFGLLEEFIFR